MINITNKEILAEIKQSYEYITDILENEYNQLSEFAKEQLSSTLRPLIGSYQEIYENIPSDDLKITIDILDPYLQRRDGYVSDIITYDYMYRDEEEKKIYYNDTFGDKWYQNIDFLNKESEMEL